MESKIIIVYVHCGQGHKKAAQGLSDSLGCPLYDLLDFSPRIIKKIYSFGYRFIVENFSLLWLVAFEITKVHIVRGIITLFHRHLFKQFHLFLCQLKPKAVIATHFFVPPVVSQVKGVLSLKNTVLITDLDVHPLWIDKGIDTYFVALKDTEERLRERGIPKEKIIVSGIPLRKGFYDRFDHRLLEKTFPLGERPRLLFISSDMGNIPFLKHVVEELKKDFALFVIYGKNKRLKRYLFQMHSPYVKGISFYENMWEIMAQCMAVITKPGGLTVCEALQLKKPLIFTHYIWGQEKKNMELLMKHGVAFFAKRPRELINTLYFIRGNQRRIEEAFSFEMDNAHKVIKEYILNI